jgi:hypothetical protein
MASVVTSFVDIFTIIARHDAGRSAESEVTIMKYLFGEASVSPDVSLL